MEEAAEFFHCSGGAADHFAVDDLLDFSNEEVNNGVADIFAAAGDESAVTDSCNSSSLSGDVLNLSGENMVNADDFCLPYDDLAELEWVSNFVEESFSGEDLQKLQFISGFKARPDPMPTPKASSFKLGFNTINSNPNPNPENGDNGPIGFNTDVSIPGKARSKRSRAAERKWASRSLLIPPVTTIPSYRPPPPSQNAARKPGGDVSSRKNRDPASADAREDRGGGGGERRCLHCATDKTPQWRTGPMGPKTLCNACGVRYKSGRLVPEYRPAASPTFVLTKHSNSHRKVMEMRRQKEVMKTTSTETRRHVDGDDYLIHQQVGPDYTLPI